MARRSKPTDERREKMIGVHVTDAEYEMLRAMAFKAHTSIPQLIRDRVLGSKQSK